MVGWLARQLKLHRSRSSRPLPVHELDAQGAPLAAEAVDLDFADALTGEAEPMRWNGPETRGLAAHFRPLMTPRADTRVEVVLRRAMAATT
jgi:hypothetical protein